MQARRLLAAAAFASAFAAAVACSSSSSGDDAAATPDGGKETGLSDGPPLDEIGPPLPPDAGTDPSFDDFEEPGGCGGWQSEGVVLTWRPAGAHGSKGACEVCVHDAGGTMWKLVVVGAGTYALESLVAREDGGAGDASWSESLAFAHADGTDAGFAAKSGMLTGAYAPAEMTEGTFDGVRVLMRIGRTGGSDRCMLVDDVRLTPR